jgi:hypothetical protein
MIAMWWQSLRYFFSVQCWVQASKTFYGALAIVVRRFWWLFAVDLVLTVVFGEFLFPMMKAKDLAAKQVINMPILLISLLAGVTWFAFYYKMGLFRYAQLSLFISFFLLCGLMVLQAFGITQIPAMHWSVHIFLKVFMILMMLYWLDSGYRFRDILISLERAMNFFLYNFAFFLCLILIALLFNLIVGSIVVWLRGVQQITFNDLLGGSIAIFFSKEQMSELSSVLSMAMLKYLKILINYFLLSALFMLYLNKKDVKYVKSIFEWDES